MLEFAVYCEKTRIHGKVPAQTLGRQSQTGRVNRVAQLFTEIGKKEVRRNSTTGAAPHVQGHKDSSANLWDWGVQSQMANSRTRRLLLSTKLLQDAPGTTSSSDFTFHGIEQMLAEITQSNGNFWKGRTEHTDSVPRGMRAA